MSPRRIARGVVRSAYRVPWHVTFHRISCAHVARGACRKVARVTGCRATRMYRVPRSSAYCGMCCITAWHVPRRLAVREVTRIVAWRMPRHTSRAEYRGVSSNTSTERLITYVTTYTTRMTEDAPPPRTPNRADTHAQTHKHHQTPGNTAPAAPHPPNHACHDMHNTHNGNHPAAAGPRTTTIRMPGHTNLTKCPAPPHPLRPIPQSRMPRHTQRACGPGGHLGSCASIATHTQIALIVRFCRH